MELLYQSDLAYVHATAFGGLASGAANEVVRRLKGSAAQIRTVLDAGCGAGPLSAALSRAGFEVTGVDISGALLESARACVPQARFVPASIYDVDLRGYDAIIAIGEPLTYHADTERVEEGFPASCNGPRQPCRRTACSSST